MRVIQKFLAFSFILFATTACATAQSFSGMFCLPTTSTPFDMRAEGVTEQAGDVVVVCTGGTPTPSGVQVPQVNITVTANANITSRLISGSNPTGVTEALLIVDDPIPAAQTYCSSPLTGCALLGTGSGGGVGGTTGSPVSVSTGSTNSYSPSAVPIGPGRFNAYAGVASGAQNVITFFGVPIDPPGSTGGNLTFRITNVRMNVSSLGTPVVGSLTTIGAFETISSSGGFSINNPVQTVGNIRSGLGSRSVTPGPSAVSQCISTASSFPILETVNFSEGYATATKLRAPTAISQLSLPGSFLNTESQFVLGGTPPTPNFGQADSGTRIKLTFGSLQPGLTILVPTAITNSNTSPITETMTLTATEAGPFLPVAASTAIGAPSGYAAIANVNGTAVAIYEVTSQTPNSPFTIETFSVPVAVSYTALSAGYTSAFGPTTVNVDFAPSTNPSFNASATEKIPRFVPTSDALPGFAMTACKSLSGTPLLALDQVTAVNGTVAFSGWALDNTTPGSPIQSVGVAIDGVHVGSATYGGARPDICALYQDRPGCPNVGLTFTGPLAAGAHTLTITATNSASPAVTASINVSVANSVSSSQSVSPSTGSGPGQVFTAIFLNSAGAAALTRTQLVINTSASTVNGCVVQVDTTGIYLLNDASTVPLGPLTVGTNLSNSQCTLNSVGTSVSSVGNIVTDTLALAFKPAFNGAKNIYMYAADGTGNSGYQLRGTYTVNTLSVPNVVSVSTNGSIGAAQSFTAVYSDTAGAAALARRLFLINSTVTGAGACLVQADATGIYLFNDAGTAPMGPLSGGNSLANSQCTLNKTGTTVVNSGTTSNVTLSLSFSAAFAGSKNIYLYADDSTGNNSGYQSFGAYTVIAAPVTASGPAAVSVSPAAATGNIQTFAAVYSDSAGADALGRRLFLINSTPTGAGACLVQTDVTGIYLYNDAGTAPMPLSGSSSITNSQCTLNSTGSSIVNSGTTSTITLALSFNNVFSGAKNIYLDADDSTGSSGYQLRGTFTVNIPVIATPVVPTSIFSVSPNAATGTIQTFTAAYSDTTGSASLGRKLFLMNSTLNIAKACLVQADATGIYLLNDSGTAPMGSLNGSNSLTNSQCTLNSTGSSVVNSGSASTVTLSLSFNVAFAGTKNIYMNTDESSTNIGSYQLRGTFNVLLTTGKPSLLWQNDTTREVTAWSMGGAQNSTYLSQNYLGAAPGWTLRGSADLNRDGVPDLLWQNDATREVTVWFMGGAQGGTYLSQNYIGATPGWTLRGAADFNGDGVPDLLWQNDTTQEVTVWFMGGPQGSIYLSQNFLGAAPGWTLQGAADFNRDGTPDLLWQNDATREVTVWFMGGAQGSTYLSQNFIGATPGWTLQGVADFNRDGTPDLLWQNDATREVTVWFMGGTQGSTYMSQNYLGATPGWSLAVH